MWTFIYLVIFVVLVIIFNHCLVEMIYSKQNKSAILYFCILFLVALALSQFSFSTNTNTLFNLETYPIPYNQYINFESVEGFDGSGSGTDTITDSGNNCATMSITDKNVFLLNDRVNKLDVNYQSLDANVKNLQTQVEDMMNKSTESAANAVGTEPYSFSSDEEPSTENDMDAENGSGSS